MSAPAARALALALWLSAPAAAGEDSGRAVFTRLAEPPCALCHTLQAAGARGKIGPSLDELRPDAARTLRAVREGVGVMPGYAGKLTQEEIEAVSRYVADAAGSAQ